MKTLFRLIVNDHIRSQRILVELVIAVATAWFVLRHMSDSQATQATLVLYSFLMTLYTTSILADSNEQPFALQRIFALPSRQSLLIAISGAAITISLATYGLLLGLGTLLNPLAMPAIGTIIMALPSLVLIMITASVVMLLMTPLVATSSQRLIALMCITIPIAWNIVVSRVNLSMPQVDGAIIAAVSTIWGIMLWPGFAVYHHAIRPDYAITSILFHLIHVLIVAGIFLLERRWFARKALTIA